MKQAFVQRDGAIDMITERNFMDGSLVIYPVFVFAFAGAAAPRNLSGHKRC